MWRERGRPTGAPLAGVASGNDSTSSSTTVEDHTMRQDTLLRAGCRAAIVAGVLRAAGSFASSGGEVERQSLYFVIDLLLLFGVFAAYAQDHERIGRWGAIGFLTTVGGILLVRSSRAVPGVDLYPAGALAVALGWMLLSLISWRAGAGSVFVPLLFALSVVTGALAETLALSTLFVASSVIFGAAVAAAGKQVLVRVGRGV
jgi:hypothetical protein